MYRGQKREKNENVCVFEILGSACTGPRSSENFFSVIFELLAKKLP